MSEEERSHGAACGCGHPVAEHGEDGCYTFLFDPEHRDLVRYCACRIALDDATEVGR